MSTQVVTQQGRGTKRRWPRYKIDVPLRAITESSTKVTIVQGRGSELNQGGMTIFAGTELAIDAQVFVEFTPPYSGQPIRVRCSVRNRTGYQYGVEFIRESEDDHESACRIEAVLMSMGSAVE